MADDASSMMMSVTDNGRTSSICERSPTQKALKGKYETWSRVPSARSTLPDSEAIEISFQILLKSDLFINRFGKLA